MVHKCQAFTEHYLLNLHFAPVLCNSIYKMEKSSRELIRTRKKTVSRFIVTKIAIQPRVLILSSVQLKGIIFCIITILLIFKVKTELSCC